MKVKAVKILALSALGYITEGMEYDVSMLFEKPYGNLATIVDDEGDIITIMLSSTKQCSHGVKWEIVE